MRAENNEIENKKQQKTCLLNTDAKFSINQQIESRNKEYNTS